MVLGMDIAAVRRAAGLTQVDIADQLGLGRYGQRNVSQMEARDDWVVSRLVRYFTAAGADTELVVRVGSDEIRFDLTKEFRDRL